VTTRYLLFSVVALLGQLSDCITTHIAIIMGGQEGNPAMVWATHPVWRMYVLKLSLALLLLTFAHKNAKSVNVACRAASIIAFIGFAAAIWNSYLIIFRL